MAYTLGDIGNVPGQAYDFLKRQAGRFVNLTKPGADDDDYTTRSAAIARQKKLADMLSQMGEQEQAVSTAGGITAPMSGMGALARGLTSFGGAYLSGKASADEAAATKAEKAAIQGGLADIFKRSDLVEQGAQQPDDAEGIPQYAANTQVGGGKYILTPEAQQRRLIELVGKHPGAVGQANLYSNLIGDERARADAETKRARPNIVAAGANGMIDNNPDSLTFGQRFAAPPPDVDKTTDITNYNYAVSQGEKRPFPAWLAAQSEGKRPSTTVSVGPTGVDYGAPGEGLVWRRDANNKVVLDERGAPIAIPYQGGKAYLTKEQLEAASGEAASNASTTSSIVRADIKNARSIMKTSEMPVTGIIGSATKGIPGTQSRVLSGLLTTIKSNVGFDKLQQMRAASPTGAALGPVSDFENKLLQAVVGDLEQSTTQDQLDRNLSRLDELVYKIVDNNGKPVNKPGSSATGTSSGTVTRGRYDPTTGKVVY